MALRLRGRGLPRGALAEPLQPREPGELLALAERVLERALGAGAEEAEVFVLETRSLGVDIERTMVEGASAGGDFGLGVRVLRARRLGFGYAAEPSRAGKAAEAALQGAKHSPREPFRFPERAPAPEPERPDRRILALSPEEAAERAQRVIEAATQVSARVELSGGGVGASRETWALANSRGVRHEETGTSIGASASAVVKDGALSTGSHHASARRDALDLEGIGSTAARLALDSRRPKSLESGSYTLLLKPDTLQELLEFCCLHGLLAENLRRKESPFAGRLGKVVAWEGLSLRDDGLLPGGLGTAARDDEGLPSRNTPLLEAGRLVGVLHDLRSAARDKARPTASAQRAERGDGERSYLAPPRAAGRNLVLDGPRKPLGELVAETRRGLLVHDLIGAHTANPVTGEFHVNSSLLFRVDRGEVVGPVRGVMVSGAMLGWLRSVSGLSEEARDLGGYLSPAALRLPWVRVEGATVHA